MYVEFYTNADDPKEEKKVILGPFEMGIALHGGVMLDSDGEELAIYDEVRMEWNVIQGPSPGHYRSIDVRNEI